MRDPWQQQGCDVSFVAVAIYDGQEGETPNGQAVNSIGPWVVEISWQVELPYSSAWQVELPR